MLDALLPLLFLAELVVLAGVHKLVATLRGSEFRALPYYRSTVYLFIYSYVFCPQL